MLQLYTKEMSFICIKTVCNLVIKNIVVALEMTESEVIEKMKSLKVYSMHLPGQHSEQSGEVAKPVTRWRFFESLELFYGV